MTRGGSTRRWRRLRAAVLVGRWCELRLPGCTGRPTHVDHIVPVSVRPDLEYEPGNLRAACASCNLRRGVKDLPPVTGPAPSPRWFPG